MDPSDMTCRMSKIDYISTIDFSNGFQRFHIKWPLNDLIKPKWSSNFETTLINGGSKIILEWSLGVDDIPEDSTHTWFGVLPITPGKIIPMINRICLSSSAKVIFNWSYFTVIDGIDYGHGIQVLSSQFDAYPIDDLMLQFWMDIPNAVAIDNNSDKLEEIKGDFHGQNSIQKASTDVFLLDHAKIFSRVVGADSDPLSDFSIIIVNKQNKELRRFHCHAVFLSARSDVFERMFASEKWKENCIKNGRSVKIKDISVQVMETVLIYIYTSILPDPSISHDHLCGIIYAADKYNLPELKNWCVGVLIHEYDWNENRIEQLILADRHNLQQLKSICLAQLSMSSYKAFSKASMVGAIPNDLWSEIMKAIVDGKTARTKMEVQEEK